MQLLTDMVDTRLGTGKREVTGMEDPETGAEVGITPDSPAIGIVVGRGMATAWALV